MIRSRLGLGAALAVVLAASPTARAAEPDKLLPADADSVVSINVKQIIGSEIIKKYALEQMKQALQGGEAQKFLGELGLDPLKDVEKVVIGASGKDQTDMKALIIIHGKFDAQKLYKAAEAQSKKDPDRFALIKDGKDVMFKLTPDNGNPVYATVVSDATVVAGTDKKLVTAALKADAGSEKPAISKDLAALVTRMDDKASVWMASVVKGKLDNVKLPGGGGAAGLPPNLGPLVGKMDTVSMVLRVTADISLDVTMGMKDQESADEMGKTVEEMLGAVKFLAPGLAQNNPQLKPLADAAKSLKSTVKERNVTVSAKLPGDAIGKMIKPGD